jgi:glycosyltransferase involved in cell wall biosynthesis
MPRISIVMSVHNDDAHLNRCLASLRAQTFQDWELIAVDDGSTDNSHSALLAFANQDSRVRVFHQPNRGLTNALTRGCDLAVGEYVARQDADDVSAPTRLARQVALLDQRADVGLVSCFTNLVGPADEQLELVTRTSDPDEATERLIRLREGPPAHGSVMFRRCLYQQVGGYRPEFYFGQDSDLWLRMVESSKIGYVPEPLYTFRIHAGSITGRHRPLQQLFGQLGHACREARLAGRSECDHLRAAAELTLRIIQERTSGALSDTFSLQMTYRIGSQLAQNRDRRAVPYLLGVLRKKPWHWRAWARLVQSHLRPRVVESDKSEHR